MLLVPRSVNRGVAQALQHSPSVGKLPTTSCHSIVSQKRGICKHRPSHLCTLRVLLLPAHADGALSQPTHQELLTVIRERNMQHCMSQRARKPHAPATSTTGQFGACVALPRGRGPHVRAGGGTARDARCRQAPTAPKELCKEQKGASSSRKTRTIARTLPASARVVNAPVYTPLASRWPMLICTLAWSLAVISLLVHELRTQQRSQSATARRSLASLHARSCCHQPAFPLRPRALDQLVALRCTQSRPPVRCCT